MNKRHALLAVFVAASSTAWAQQYEDYARVESAVPEYERVHSPREECYSQYEPAVRRDRDYAGAVIGGITGGVIGAQVGRGNGNRAATAVGAITGAIIGDRIQNANGYEEYGEREVRRCRSADHWENRFVGYRVTYEYAGRRYTTILSENPGRRVPVRVQLEPLGNGVRTSSGW